MSRQKGLQKRFGSEGVGVINAVRARLIGELREKFGTPEFTGALDAKLFAELDAGVITAEQRLYLRCSIHGHNGRRIHDEAKALVDNNGIRKLPVANHSINRKALKAAKKLFILEQRKAAKLARKQKRKENQQRNFATSTPPKRTNDGWWTLYGHYLESPAWKAFRAGILSERGHKCERCSSVEPPLHVHHLTYARVGKEQPEDVVVLCVPCHEKEHERRSG